MIPAYVINLPRDSARLARIQAQFAVLEGFAVTYVNAVDGSTLADCVCEFLSDSDFWAKYKGAIGCFLSHIRVWEMIAGAEYRYAAVIEDDADVARLDQLSALILPNDFDIVFINARMSPNIGGHGVVGMAEALTSMNLGLGTDGYLLTPAAAARLVDAVSRDLVFGHIDGRLVRYATSPSELAELGDAQVASVVRNHHHARHMPKLGLLKGYASAMPLVRHLPGPSTRTLFDAPPSAAQPSLPSAPAPHEIMSGREPAKSEAKNLPAQIRGGLKIAGLADVARTKEIIFGGCEAELAKVCVYQNVHEFNPDFAEHLKRDIYAARTASFAPIELVTLPAGAVVHGNLDYVTTLDDVFIAEQFHQTWFDEKASQRRALDSTAPIIQFDEPALLAARFGEHHWDRWLGETLPRLVAADSAAPGKYRFAVPAEITEANEQDTLMRDVLGSLRAYGITEDRLLRIDRQHRYVFSNLAAVTSMWVYPYAIHPEALAMLRTRLSLAVPSALPVVRSAALLGHSGGARDIQNEDEILDLLKIKDFSAVDISLMPFIEQVGLFQRATSLFGVLGPSLTGLIYSPPGIRTVSAAPGAWGDCFLHGLIQAQEGVYADLRGTPDPAVGTAMWAPFTLSIVRLAEALEAVQHGR